MEIPNSCTKPSICAAIFQPRWVHSLLMSYISTSTVKIAYLCAEPIGTSSGKLMRIYGVKRQYISCSICKQNVFALKSYFPVLREKYGSESWPVVFVTDWLYLITSGMIVSVTVYRIFLTEWLLNHTNPFNSVHIYESRQYIKPLTDFNSLRPSDAYMRQ